MERHGCGGSRLQRRMTSESSFHFTVKAEGFCANVLVALRRPHRGSLPLASSSSFTPLSGLVFKAENQIIKFCLQSFCYLERTRLTFLTCWKKRNKERMGKPLYIFHFHSLVLCAGLMGQLLAVSLSSADSEVFHQ